MSTEKYTAPERPAYRVLDVAGFFGDDDTLYPEGSEIFFDGEPSVEMEPLNEAARVKMIALLEKLEEKGREAAEKAGRPYTGRPRSLEGGLALASAIQRAEMAVMGAQKHSENITPIQEGELPVFGDQKKPRGRPRKIA